VKRLILCDARLPYPVKFKLSVYGEVIEIQTDDLTYSAISGHPDVFCCQVGDVLVVSPTLPEKYTSKFTEKGIKWIYGSKPTGMTYPESAGYNAVVTDKFLIHNLLLTDSLIKTTAGKRKQINVKQGYTRCNLLAMPGDVFITSDTGIFKALVHEGYDVLNVDPEGIVLEGFPNGFIGGVCGVEGDKVFIAGSLSKYKEGGKIREFLSCYALTPVELYDGELIDGGSILFI